MMRTSFQEGVRFTADQWHVYKDANMAAWEKARHEERSWDDIWIEEKNRKLRNLQLRFATMFRTVQVNE